MSTTIYNEDYVVTQYGRGYGELGVQFNGDHGLYCQVPKDAAVRIAKAILKFYEDEETT